MFWLSVPRRVVIVVMVNEGRIQTSYNSSPRRTKLLVNAWACMGWCFCEEARDVEKLWGRRESLFGVSTFVTPKNVTSPAMQCTACQHFQTGPSSSATSPLQRPAPLPGAYIFMNLSSYSIQFRPLCHSLCPESPRLNQSHPSETTVLVTHALWQKQSQTCICCRVPFKAT